MVFIDNADMKRLRKLVRRDEILSRQLNLETLKKNLCLMIEEQQPVRLVCAIGDSLDKPIKEYEDFLYLEEYLCSELGLQDSQFYEGFIRYSRGEDINMNESTVSLLFLTSMKKTIFLEDLDIFLSYQDNHLINILNNYLYLVSSGYGYSSDMMFLDIYRYVRSFDFDYYQIDKSLAEIDKNSINNSLMLLLAKTDELINKDRL